MAWSDACKLEAVAQIDKRKEKLGSVRAAIREISEESGIPQNTLKRWKYPETDYKCTRNGTPYPSTESETCATYPLYTQDFDSGRKKLVYGVCESHGNRLFTIKEYRVTRDGKEVATRNRLILPLDLFCQFLVHSVMIKEELSGKSEADSPGYNEDEVGPPDGENASVSLGDAIGPENEATEISPKPADSAEDTAVEAELVQCADCLHFAAKKWAPEENGACNARSGPWNGKIFQPPYVPHICPNFQDKHSE
ncbi:MAG: hypothetical protein ACOZFS_00265 [Thermodesulfobacteriota bacterium]